METEAKRIAITRCDACGCAFPPDLKEMRSDEGVVVTMFYCPYCRKQYVVSVTDGLSRKLIDDYADFSERYAAGKLDAFEISHMEKLRGVILEHSRELMEQYRPEQDGE